MSSVVLRNHFAAARVIVRSELRNAYCAAGKDLAKYTQGYMHPGYFYDQGTSHDNTFFEMLSEMAGQVRILTYYSGFVEYGTVHMAARPAMTPAIAENWPRVMHERWAERHTLPRADSPAPPRPAIDQHGNAVA